MITLPGHERILAAQGAALPQPDQLCGPFTAYAVLHAVLEHPPGLLEIAAAAGTAIWPHDVPGWRPAGAPLDRTGWDVLPRAAIAADSGTDAAGLARAVETLAPSIAVLPVSGSSVDAARLTSLLTGLATLPHPVGVIANLRTGPLDPTGEPTWDVGHFVALWALAGDGSEDGASVAIADTYAELGDPGEPPGCRWVPTGALAAGVSAPPGRGLLLLVSRDHADGVRVLVEGLGLTSALWST